MILPEITATVAGTEKSICPAFGNLIVKEIQGLSPVPVELQTVALSGIPGEHYISRTWPTREIAIVYDSSKVGQPLAADRKQLLSFLKIGSSVSLLLSRNDKQRWIYGIVTAMETQRFSEDTTITAKIRCMSPFFRGKEQILINQFKGSMIDISLTNGGGLSWPELSILLKTDSTYDGSHGLRLGFRRNVGGTLLPILILDLSKYIQPGAKEHMVNLIISTDQERRGIQIQGEGQSSFVEDMSVIVDDVFSRPVWEWFSCLTAQSFRMEVDRGDTWTGIPCAAGSHININLPTTFNGVRL